MGLRRLLPCGGVIGERCGKMVMVGFGGCFGLPK
jgi:hypothetical protein